MVTSRRGSGWPSPISVWQLNMGHGAAPCPQKTRKQEQQCDCHVKLIRGSLRAVVTDRVGEPLGRLDLDLPLSGAHSWWYTRLRSFSPLHWLPCDLLISSDPHPTTRRQCSWGSVQCPDKECGLGPRMHCGPGVWGRQVPKPRASTCCIKHWSCFCSQPLVVALTVAQLSHCERQLVGQVQHLGQVGLYATLQPLHAVLMQHAPQVLRPCRIAPQHPVHGADRAGSSLAWLAPWLCRESRSESRQSRGVCKDLCM